MDDHKPDYVAIADLHDLKDRIDQWINYEKQPEAYRAPADSLGDMAARLAKIAGDNMVRRAENG